MPNQPLYEEFNEWLQTNWTGRGDRMKRITTRVNQINEVIRLTVFNRYLVQII